MQHNTSGTSNSRKRGQSAVRMPTPVQRPVGSQLWQTQNSYVQNIQTAYGNGLHQSFDLPDPHGFYSPEDLPRLNALAGIDPYNASSNAHVRSADVDVFGAPTPRQSLHFNPSRLGDSELEFPVPESTHAHSLTDNPYSPTVGDIRVYSHKDHQASSWGNTRNTSMQTGPRRQSDHARVQQKTDDGPSNHRFKCDKPNCDYSTNRSDLFKRHNNSGIHNNVQSFTCRYQCGKTTTRGDNMQQHEATCERNPDRFIAPKSRGVAKK